MTTSIDTTNTIEEIANWFVQAVPEPTDKNRSVQVGCHLEEVAEMAGAFGEAFLARTIDGTAGIYKTAGTIVIDDQGIDRKELLDSLADQIVTAVGVAHMFNLDIIGGLAEVNRSNWSKFVDGKPVFNEHGKIAKGPDYTPPDLNAFVGGVGK